MPAEGLSAAIEVVAQMDRSMAYMATLYTLESAGGGSFTSALPDGELGSMLGHQPKLEAQG